MSSPVWTSARMDGTSAAAGSAWSLWAHRGWERWGAARRFHGAWFDLDRTARNAVTGVDQRRVVADYAIELPLFRGSITPRALTWEKLQQPSSRASTLVTGCPPYPYTHNKCTGVCRFVRGIAVGISPRVADLWGFCGARRQVTQRGRDNLPARGGSAPALSADSARVARRLAWRVAGGHIPQFWASFPVPGN
jgi:hypothetical protein